MLLWILIFCLTAAAIMAVLVPLSRPQPGSDAAAHARAVYRDQLQELEKLCPETCRERELLRKAIDDYPWPPPGRSARSY